MKARVAATGTVVFAIITLFCSPAPSADEIMASPRAVMANPDHFDGKAIVMEGTVTNIFFKISRRGNPYYTFDLTDGAGSVKVFSFGKPVISEGDRVKVSGRFMKEKRVGKYIFYNEIDASAGAVVRKVR